MGNKLFSKFMESDLESPLRSGSAEPKALYCKYNVGGTVSNFKTNKAAWLLKAERGRAYICLIVCFAQHFRLRKLAVKENYFIIKCK